MSLQIQNVTKVFPLKDKGSFTAVQSLSYDFQPNRFYTLLGPSGCGKTTLLRMIAGFENVSSGMIRFEGRELTAVPPHERGFPMVFQSYALFPHMTVTENIGYGLKLRGVQKADLRDRVQKMVELLRLNGNEHKYPQQMSGGQQQRVALARALVIEPKVILFDEPLSNLDAQLRISMRTEIRALQKRLGLTAIYVTHDQEEAMAVSDEVLVMNQGRIEQSGAPTDLYHRPRTEFVARFFGATNVFEVDSVSTDRNQVQFRLWGMDFDCEPGTELRPALSRPRVVIRPNAVRIASSGVPAQVMSSSYLGSHVRYVLNVEGHPLEADHPWTHQEGILTEGTSTHVEIDPKGLHILP